MSQGLLGRIVCQKKRLVGKLISRWIQKSVKEQPLPVPPGACSDSPPIIKLQFCTILLKVAFDSFLICKCRFFSDKTWSKVRSWTILNVLWANLQKAKNEQRVNCKEWSAIFTTTRQRPKKRKRRQAVAWANLELNWTASRKRYGRQEIGRNRWEVGEISLRTVGIEHMTFGMFWATRSVWFEYVIF